jgi:hypothetical protein
MKKKALMLMALAFAIVSGCEKGIQTEKASPGTSTEKKSTKTQSLSSCQPVAWLLHQPTFSWIGSVSFLYQVSGAPGFTPIVSSPVIGSAGTSRLENCAGVKISDVSGLAYDPGTGIFYGTTSSGSGQILSFTDPSCVTQIPAVSSCIAPGGFKLQDLERDPASGNYYALDHNSSVVQVDVLTGTVTCLPNSTGVGCAGLTFDCSGQLYLLSNSFSTGYIHAVDKTTGLITTTYPSFYMIVPDATPTHEVGLHFDCACINRFITGHKNSISKYSRAVEMTSYLPAALGGPLFDSVSGFIPETIDFATP